MHNNYGDPVRARRKVVWDLIEGICLLRDEEWALIGDFNELLKKDEKFGGNERQPSTFWDIQNMVENCKVREKRSTGNTFSWAGKDNVWIHYRLDRCFGNIVWFNLFPKSQVDYMDMLASDRPLKLNFMFEEHLHSRGRFFFDKRMMDKEGVEDVVKEG